MRLPFFLQYFMPAALFLFYFMYSHSIRERDSKADEWEAQREAQPGQINMRTRVCSSRWFFYHLLKKSKLNLRQKLCGFPLFFYIANKFTAHWGTASEWLWECVRECLGMCGSAHNSGILFIKLILLSALRGFFNPLCLLVVRSGFWNEDCDSSL